MVFFRENTENVKNQRIVPRVEFREPITVFSPETQKKDGCLSLDISEGGMKVFFDRFVAPETPVAVEFQLFPGERFLLNEGRVVWAHALPSSDMHHVGIRFVNQDLSNQQDLRRYIKSQQII